MTRAGMNGAPAALLVTPEDVARKILIAVGTRPRVLNAVPWQTAFVALAELFPRLTDAVLARNPALVGTAEVAAEQSAALPTAPVPEAAPEPPPAEPLPGFDAVLGAVRRRMERVRLDEQFVRGLLRDGAVLDPNEVALQWAGMPNKNERAATIEVLDALTDGGFLQRDGERYRVVRTPG